MTVADRIAVMDRGRLMQVAPPAEIYGQPNSRWVADFIGTINLFEGRVGDAAGTIEGTALGRLRITGKIDAEPNATVWVAVRPEKIRLIPCAVEPTQRANAENCVLATVVDIGYLGDLSLYKLRTEAGVPLQAAIANIGPLTRAGLAGTIRCGLVSRRKRQSCRLDERSESRMSPQPQPASCRYRSVAALRVAGRIFFAAIFNRAQDQLVAERDCAAALHASLRSVGRLERRAIVFCKPVAGQLRLPRLRPALCRLLHEEPADCGVFHAAAAGDRLPIAYAITRTPPRLQAVLVVLVILPFWTSFLIRIYAWMNILQHDGPLNQLLLALHIVREPPAWLSTNTAVYIGIVYSYLPFMVLPLYAALEKLDQSLLEAAADLGCPRWRTFWAVTLPLSAPGVIAGSLLCFIPIVGEFVIPDLLGGSQTAMIGQAIWSEFFSNKDWPTAAAVAVVLVCLLVTPIVVFQHQTMRGMERD